MNHHAGEINHRAGIRTHPPTSARRDPVHPRPNHPPTPSRGTRSSARKGARHAPAENFSTRGAAMGACCRSGYPLSPCRPMPAAPYAAAAEDAPPYPPAPPNLGLSCSSAGESKHEKQPIAGQEGTPGRRAAQRCNIPFASAFLLCRRETLIAPGGGGGGG